MYICLCVFGVTPIEDTDFDDAWCKKRTSPSTRYTGASLSACGVSGCSSALVKACGYGRGGHGMAKEPSSGHGHIIWHGWWLSRPETYESWKVQWNHHPR